MNTPYRNFKTQPVVKWFTRKPAKDQTVSDAPNFMEKTFRKNRRVPQAASMRRADALTGSADLEETESRYTGRCYFLFP
jgi:hypothetical protein